MLSLQGLLEKSAYQIEISKRLVRSNVDLVIRTEYGLRRSIEQLQKSAVLGCYPGQQFERQPESALTID